MELVPAPVRISQVSPQYTIIDEQTIQQYQPSKEQLFSVQPSQENLNVDLNKSKNQLLSPTRKKSLLEFIMCLLIGLVICGIPLAVMTPLYVQKKSASSSDSSGSSDGSSNSANLPSQCYSYYSNSDPTRLTSFTGCSSCIFDTSGFFSTGWYRFTGTGGTKLATSPSNSGTCGASYPAWYNGTFPATVGSTISTSVCVNVNGNLCHTSYILPISITNCDTYYLFYLQPTPISNIRYCTTF